MKSILKTNKQCYKCKTIYGLHEHHIFSGTANRKLSEQYGLKVWLCGKHHNLSNAGIHFDRDFELEVKRMTQEKAMQFYGWSEQEFIKIFGKSYKE